MGITSGEAGKKGFRRGLAVLLAPEVSWVGTGLQHQRVAVEALLCGHRNSSGVSMGPVGQSGGQYHPSRTASPAGVIDPACCDECLFYVIESEWMSTA
jgi:hypothetical protein